MRLFYGLFAALAAALSLLPAAAQTPTPTPPPAVEILIAEPLADYPHDTASFTQGLLLHEGSLYESAGQYGQSDLRRVELETGAVVQQVGVPEAYFAEGLALVDDRLIQLTWREGTAFVYDRQTFERLGEFRYEGEGWGLCYDGQQLYMSDGTERLTVRDPRTFEVVDEVQVRLEGTPVSRLSLQGRPDLTLDRLNELECVDDVIYANVWYTDFILRIDKKTGAVTALIYAGMLLTAEEQAALASGAVLNGIAYDPKDETFLLTGKYWPKLFRVQFVSVKRGQNDG